VVVISGFLSSFFLFLPPVLLSVTRVGWLVGWLVGWFVRYAVVISGKEQV